jgi:hypothetical protein
MVSMVQRDPTTLSNIGSNTYSQIDSFITSTATSISNRSIGTSIIKSNANAIQNTAISTTYLDGVDGAIYSS